MSSLQYFFSLNIDLFSIFQSLAETNAETKIKNNRKTLVICGFNPPLQVYQPQVYGLFQEPLVTPQNYGLHCQEQFVAPQLYGHQPQQVYQPCCVYFGKHEAEAELDFEAKAEAGLDFETKAEAVLDFEADSQYLRYTPCASAYTAGYSFGAYDDGYYNIEGYLGYYGYGIAGVCYLNGYPSTYNTVYNGQGRRPPGF